MSEQYCPRCGIEYTTAERPLTQAALGHWLDAHSDTDRLHEILTSTQVRVECTECGRTFTSPVSFGAGRIAADSCCPECVEADRFRQLYVQELSPAELLECEVKPAGEEDSDA